MKKRILLSTFVALFASNQALAGGGYILTSTGDPSLWDNSSSIIVHPESGACASFSNSDMVEKVRQDLSYWSDLSEVDIAFSVSSGNIGGIDGCNYGDFLVGVTGSDDDQAVNDGYNPVIFDNDGDIVAAVAGSSNRYNVLGFANPAGFTSDYSEIVDGQAVFNCLCLADNSFGPCTTSEGTYTEPEEELDFTIVHEMGHFLNLTHTQVNSDLVDNGNEDDDDNIPTMYPISENAAKQITPIQDDISALGSLYPSSNFFVDNNTSSLQCRVVGTLLDSNGTDPLRCADVQAIPADRSKSVAFVSGAYAVATDANNDNDTTDDGECESGCGDFELYLDPGVDYTISIKSINSDFTGGSAVYPCRNDQKPSCDVDCPDIQDFCNTLDPDSTRYDTCVENYQECLDDCIENEDLGEPYNVSAAECVAGETIDLGEIHTQSTAGVSMSVSSSASLVAALEDTNLQTVIGGDVAPQYQTSDCPESDGSSSSSSSSSASGCQLATTATGDFSGWTTFALALIGLAGWRLKKSKRQS